MIEGFELFLLLVVVIGIVVTVSRRIGAPWPVLLVVAGLALSFIPGLSHVELDSDVVLVLFLPPLLFGAAWYTPVQEFKRYRRPILLLSVGLVLFTTFVVAFVAAAVVPGLALAAAFALGAIVAPPDAISAVAVLRPLAVPRRLLSILEGESLVNDATALTAYGIAVTAVMTGVFVPTDALFDFVRVVAVGLVVGIGVAVVCGWIWARLFDPPVEISLSLVIPYLAYLPAVQSAARAIAVVSAGLYLGYRSSRILASDARVLGTSVWAFVTYILNGFAFLLIGLELPAVLDAVRTSGIPTEVAVGSTVAVCLAVVVARMVWVFPSAYLPRLVPSIARNEPRPPAAAVFVVGWAGMRGAVSLAAALALPPAFPQRDLLVLIAFSVILVTLVGQGLTLAPLIRSLRITPGDEVQREEEVARRTAVEAALAELERLRGVWPDHLPLLDRLAVSFDHRLEHLGGVDGEITESEQERLEHREILASVIGAERESIISMRARGEIDDGVLRDIERELDLEELRLSAEA